MKASCASTVIATGIAVVAGLYFALPTLSRVASNRFPGIYSIIDPVTGETKDVLKVKPLLGEYVVLARFAGQGPWNSGPIYAKVMANGDSYASPPLFQQDRMASALSLGDMGYLYHTPGNSDSRVGPSDTGYISNIASFGITPPVPPAAACGPRRARGAGPARVHARQR